MATVWVLGAGFSKPLGGPLLTELFSEGSELKVKTCFPRLTSLGDRHAQLARALFRHPALPKQWQDAEEFLDYLDTAQLGGEEAPSFQALVEMFRALNNSSSTSYLVPDISNGVLGALINPVAVMSRRLLAAECCAFLVNADVKTEKWRPPLRWTEKVAPGDTVITFNYDLVIEMLARATEGRRTERFVFPAFLPTGESYPRSPTGESYPRQVTVLKLHGSVNWMKWKNSLGQRATGTSDITVADNDYFALNCPEEEMVIASPGPTKLATAGGSLFSLWEAAKAALRRADSIVFIGYRFPPSDSAARRELIDAIGENKKHHLVLHTVLGPKVHNDDTERLKSMLEVAMARQGRWLLDKSERPYVNSEGTPLSYSLRIWPLWAQDFLDLYDPAQLRAAP